MASSSARRRPPTQQAPVRPPRPRPVRKTRLDTAFTGWANQPVPICSQTEAPSTPPRWQSRRLALSTSPGRTAATRRGVRHVGVPTQPDEAIDAGLRRAAVSGSTGRSAGWTAWPMRDPTRSRSRSTTSASGPRRCGRSCAWSAPRSARAPTGRRTGGSATPAGCWRRCAMRRRSWPPSRLCAPGRMMLDTAKRSTPSLRPWWRRRRPRPRRRSATATHGLAPVASWPRSASPSSTGRCPTTSTPCPSRSGRPTPRRASSSRGAQGPGRRAVARMAQAGEAAVVSGAPRRGDRRACSDRWSICLMT